VTPKPSPSDVPPLYESRSAGVWWNKRKKNRDGEWETEPTRLSNFRARIAVEITEDNGSGNPKKVYEIQARLPGDTEPHTFTVPAEEYRAMSWVDAKLGALARVMPGYGLADRLRDAIRCFSSKVERRTVYTHTGWRKLDDVWHYLHANGAITPSGLGRDVSVRLHERLQRIALPEPPRNAMLTKAVRASLSLLDVAAHSITIPSLAATYLAPLQEALGNEAAVDFVPAFIGATQVFKSELAALQQSHFGQTFTRVTLPANFEDTEHAHEGLLFAAKDVLLVVDDYCPSSRPQKDASAMRLKAARLVRAIGNRACRGRMNPDTTLREDLPPRSMAAITGEEGLAGESTLGRIFPIEVAKGAVDREKLTKAQQQRPQYALAMAGYLRWLACQMDVLKTTLPGEYVELRDRARQEAEGAAREPGQIAHLYLGFSRFLEFAVSVRALTSDERQTLLDEAWHVLTARSVARQTEAKEEDPVERFRGIIGDAFPARRLYVEDPDGGEPQDAERWGWISLPQGGEGEYALRPTPTALMAGWLDKEFLYLIPEVAKTFLRREGISMPWTDLLKRLDEAGAIEARTYKRNGKEMRERVLSPRIGVVGTKRVVMVRRRWLEGAEGGAEAVTGAAAVTPGKTKT
jgi:hypothetical protein